MRQLFLFLLLSFALNLNGQDTIRSKPKEEISKWSINLVTGPCFPLGDYGSRKLENSRAGFSMVGLSTKLRAGYQVSKNLFVIADAIWFYNPVDANTFLNAYTSTHPSITFDSYKITTNSWKTYGLMAGVSKAFTFNDITFELKGLVGVVRGDYSNVIVKQYDFDLDSTAISNYNGEKTYQIAMNIGFNFKTKLNKSVGLCLGGDYLATEMRFKKLTVEQSNGIKSSIGSYNQPVTVFQLSAGFYVEF